MAKVKANFRIPVHPGKVLLDYIEGHSLTQVQAAKALKVSSVKLNEIIRGKRGLSAEMALRLSRVFNQPPEFWTSLQMNWELCLVDKTKLAGLKKVS